jgi:hypothetical protein
MALHPTSQADPSYSVTWDVEAIVTLEHTPST